MLRSGVMERLMKVGTRRIRFLIYSEHRVIRGKQAQIGKISSLTDGIHEVSMALVMVAGAEEMSTRKRQPPMDPRYVGIMMARASHCRWLK